MFKNNLRRLRTQADWSQTDLADYLGMTRLTYSKLESGRKSPTLVELEQLSEVLQTSFEELVDSSTDTQVIEQIEKTNKKTADKPRQSIRFNRTKLKNVVLYVLNELGGQPHFGETTLYKLLYFIDFDYYEKFSKSITGLRYKHNLYGPTPNGHRFQDFVEAAKADKTITVVQTKFHDKPQKKYLANIKPNLKRLSQEEIQHIDEVIQRLGSKNAAELTEHSHQDTPWVVTKQGQEMDYQFSKYRTQVTSVVTDEDEL